MSTIKKIKKFQQEFEDLGKGESARKLSTKALRQAENAIGAEISSLQFKLPALENDVEEAKEFLRVVRLNRGESITDQANYIQTMYEAQNAVTLAEKGIDSTNKKIKFLKDQLEYINTDVQDLSE